MRFPDHSDLGVVTVEGAGDFLVSMDRVGAAPADVGLVNDMDCPLVGGHEHAFRGPHYFREWLPGTRPVPYALDVERLARALRKTLDPDLTTFDVEASARAYSEEASDEQTRPVARGTHSRGLPEHGVSDVPSGSRPPRPPSPPKDREWDGS